MYRQLWQATMIALARSNRCKRVMQGRRSTSGLARRYVAGDDVMSAVRCAKRLKAEGIDCSAFYLGEYVDTEDKVRENLDAKRAVIEAFAANGLDVHVSVDPTQLGCSIDWDAGCERIERLADHMSETIQGGAGSHCLMLDMEDSSVTERTIALHDRLTARGRQMALTLQAYLKRSRRDVEVMIEQGATVRLVKGAFVAGPEIAYVSQGEIKENYRSLIDLMLSSKARKSGFSPVFATHDHRLHAYAIECARENGWRQGDYGFEMLYGARDDVARQLAASGEAIRLYLPFGEDWWPYAMRRIGENPRSLFLLLRGLIGR